MAPDSFDIVFVERQTVVKTIHHRRIKYKYINVTNNTNTVYRITEYINATNATNKTNLINETEIQVEVPEESKGNPWILIILGILATVGTGVYRWRLSKSNLIKNLQEETEKHK